jgi:CRISPR/Cas system CSM-associated protein Csm3 (group 7 of RAMP superfamily)
MDSKTVTLKYKIKFLDYWHLSSGLSAGAKHDSLVVKDSKGIAFLPGKTLKGLLREMAELLENKVFVKMCFGAEGVEMGSCYFSNAFVSKEVHEQIVSNKLQDNLYDEIASTKIENGMAVDNSLREIEVVVPIALFGEINDVPNEHKEQMIQALKMIKRMGLNRNRGLGRCTITVEVA